MYYGWTLSCAEIGKVGGFQYMFHVLCALLYLCILYFVPSSPTGSWRDFPSSLLSGMKSREKWIFGCMYNASLSFALLYLTYKYALVCFYFIHYILSTTYRKQVFGEKQSNPSKHSFLFPYFKQTEFVTCLVLKYNLAARTPSLKWHSFTRVLTSWALIFTSKKQLEVLRIRDKPLKIACTY